MATVIDSLVVALNLDPKGFTQGQQQATTGLQHLQTQAGQTAQQFQLLGVQIGRFMATIQTPVAAASQQLNNISQQTQKSTSGITQGLQTAAVGFRALTTAGLAAYATINALHNVFSKLTTTLAASAATGGLAQLMGGPGARATGLSGAPGVAPWLSREAIAARLATGAPEAETQETIFQLQQDIIKMRTSGEFSERLQALSKLGVGDLGRGTPADMERLFNEIAKKAVSGNWSPEEVQNILGPVLGRRFVQYLQQGPEGREANLARARTRQLTDQEAAAAQNLQRSLDNLSTSWDSLIRTLETRWSPTLTNINNGLAAWGDQLKQQPGLLDAVGIAVMSLAGVISLGFIARIAGWMIALNPFIRALQLIGLVVGAGVVLKELTPPNDDWEKDIRKDKSADAPGLIEGARQWLRRLFGYDKKDAPTAAPAAPGPTGQAAPTGYTGPPVSGTQAGVAAATAAEAQRQGVDPALVVPTAGIESSWGQNPGDPMKKYAGIFQLGGSERAEVGGSATPGELGSTGEQIRQGVAYMKLVKARLWRRLGREPTNAEVYLAHQQGVEGAALLLGNPNTPAGQLVHPSHIAQNAGDPNAPASVFVEHWRRKFAEYGGRSAQYTGAPGPAAPPVNFMTGLGSLRAANAGAYTSSTSTVNNSGRNVTVGDINVVAPSGDPLAIGGATASALKRQLEAAQANTGLE